MSAGKSTAGSLVAAAIGRAFVKAEAAIFNARRYPESHRYL
jgi:shikimate kinase